MEVSITTKVHSRDHTTHSTKAHLILQVSTGMWGTQIISPHTDLEHGSLGRRETVIKHSNPLTPTMGHSPTIKAVLTRIIIKLRHNTMCRPTDPLIRLAIFLSSLATKGNRQRGVQVYSLSTTNTHKIRLPGLTILRLVNTIGILPISHGFGLRGAEGLLSIFWHETELTS
jgi:hypothetical protein